MSNLKKYIIQIATIFILFLSPLSFSINSSQGLSEARISPLVEINVNTAYALSVPCKGGWMSFIDNTACGIGNIILTYFELFWFYTTQILAVLAGLMLDFFMFFSIDSQFYRSGMIDAGWEILRDFTNILFIFALLVSAFKMVLGIGSADAKRKVIYTILIALVINFSLFVSYAVIDSSNIFAHVFYNKIESGKVASYQNTSQTTNNASSGNMLGESNGSQTGDINNNEGGNDIVKLTEKFLGATGANTRSVSLGVMSNINPQRIITGADINNFGQAFITVIMSGLMNLLLIYLFLSITILFVGRTLGLMMLAILSPLAFSSILIPSLENNKYIGLKNWFSQLISLSFMAPIFIFFMYLTVTFISSKGMLASLNSHNDTFFGRIMSVYMLFFMIGGMLWFAKKITKDMAGEIGDLFGKAIAGATGAIVTVGAMAVTGGASAMAGGAGRVGTMLGKKGATGLRGALHKGGSKLRSTSRTLASTKFDVAKMPGFKQIAGDKVTGLIGSVSGRSILGHVSNKRKEMQQAKGSIFDIETDKIGKDNIERAKAKAKRTADKSKTAVDWQREVKKQEEEIIADRVARKAKNDLDANATVKTEQGREKQLYRDMIANPDLVKKEEKEIKNLTQELSNLSTTLSSAKATGTPAQIALAESSHDIKKVQLDARKKGWNLSETEAESLLMSSGVDVNTFTSSQTPTTYSTSGAGGTADSFKSDYERQRDETQKVEITEIRTEIARLRGLGKNKEADLLSKKIPDILTDSTKKKKYKKDEDD